MTVDAWLEAAIADAQRRGLRPLTVLLETLARSTAALRAADLELQSSPEGDDKPGGLTSNE
jgi:hypothetical protein